jgi:hypothetical protein
MISIAQKSNKAFLWLWALCILGASASAWAADDDDAAAVSEQMKKYHFETVTTKEGLKFNVPPDMPIEKKDGLVQPVPFDQYLYVKFKLIEERMTAVEKKLDSSEKTLDSLDRKLDALKAQISELTASSKAAAAAPGDTTAKPAA